MAASATTSIPLHELGSAASRAAGQVSGNHGPPASTGASRLNAPPIANALPVDAEQQTPVAANGTNAPASSQDRLLKFLTTTWLGNIIAGIGLVIALFVLGLSAYSIYVQEVSTRWTVKNDALQSCMSWYAIHKTSAYCNATIRKGVIEPPIVRRESSHSDTTFDGIWQNFPNAPRIGNPTILTSLLIGSAVLFTIGYLWRLRSAVLHESQPFESPAKTTPMAVSIFENVLTTDPNETTATGYEGSVTAFGKDSRRRGRGHDFVQQWRREASPSSCVHISNDHKIDADGNSVWSYSESPCTSLSVSHPASDVSDTESEVLCTVTQDPGITTTDIAGDAQENCLQESFKSTGLDKSKTEVVSDVESDADMNTDSHQGTLESHRQLNDRPSSPISRSPLHDLLSAEAPRTYEIVPSRDAFRPQ